MQEREGEKRCGAERGSVGERAREEERVGTKARKIATKVETSVIGKTT